MLENHLLRRLFKGLTLVLLLYIVLAGFTRTLPPVGTLEQSSRNLFFHVPMWFSMYLMMLLSLVWSICQLRTDRVDYDIKAREAASIGVFFGLMGLLTGMVWSRVTWGEALPASDPYAWWAWDPKQTMALAAVLIYLAYFVLRSSVEDPRKRARLSAVYNVFAAAALFPLTYIIPRTVPSLHPGGADGNPINFKDSGIEYRFVFYPAIIAFMFLGLWLLELRVRQARLQHRLDDKQSTSH
jgi:heme exporter protein C